MSQGPDPALGRRLGNRYVIEELAERGGMGAVYRARDEVTGSLVALKLVSREDGDATRLHQEARVLSELRHPAIVRYLDHGRCEPDVTFLAMEWLDGEDLSARLARAGLGVGESLAVLKRIAEGLAVVHARGLIHRDVKPSNIRLAGGSPERATLVDFGVACSLTAHRASLAPRVTGAGIVLGTVGYMSPEQATGEPGLDARSDVFALGCVLFECLTGQPAFAGVHVMAVLAKVLRERAPRMRDLRPDLPAAVDDLVARMLAKDRALRPTDAAAVVDELARLPSLHGTAPEPATGRQAGLSANEQRPVSVMLALVPGGTESDVEAIVKRSRGDLSRLANGGLLVTLAGRGGTDEQVANASACALALRSRFPGARIGLSTGWASSDGTPPGPLIDQAATLLAQSMGPGLRIDDVTAGLLRARFEVRREGQSFALVGPRIDIDSPRTLLGKALACVGRDRELDLLFQTLRESIDESVARAVVMTGPAGQGKSRVVHELLARAGREGVDVRVLAVRGDPIAPGSSLAVAGRLVRKAASLREGTPDGIQRGELTTHVERLCGASEAPWIADFLAELLGLTPGGATASERFRAASNDARTMSDGLRRAFAAWIGALCTEKPLLVVVDDLQWADAPTLSYLSDALRTLRDRPLTVLALGRPEARTTFPLLWEGTDKVDVALPRLGQRAAEGLVQAALGPDADPRAIARIVERADGNALYMEELVRHAATKGTSELPETVLALAHWRIEHLDAEARRIVRAASIFGRACWRRGLASLLGIAVGDSDLDRGVALLVEGELLEPVTESRFDGEAELAFRASVVRDAAYATLTDSDRATGHLLAAEWLEGVGERDALRLAEHYDRSRDRRRALAWLPRAATTALKAGGFDAAVALCERATALDPEGIDRGKVLQTEGIALAMRGDLRAGAGRLRTAMSCFEPGTSRWFACVATLLLTGTFLGDTSITAPLVGAVLDPAMGREPSGPYGVVVYAAAVGLAMVGHLDAADGFLGRAERLAEEAAVADPTFVVAVELTRAALCLARGEIGGALRELAGARAITERTDDASGQLLVALHESAAFAEVGDEARCREAAQRLAGLAGKLGAVSFADWGQLSVAQVRLAQGRGQGLVAELSDLATRLDPMFVAFARAMLSQALLAAGEHAEAERAADRARDDATMFPGPRAAALGTLAQLAVRRGDPGAALELAREGIAAASLVGSPRDMSILLLAEVEALSAAGRIAEERVALEKAQARVRRIAASIDDADLRVTYATCVEANARTLDRTVAR